ncbi:MAG: T9SS type A sorting domain-containing protein [Chitinispirillaceae bacterium]|nr:T9SS type A sorting domain-containing protein [Chitinispirillaceae bacterium]
MKQFLCLIALTAFATTLLATPKFPFPQNAKYAYGIKPANVDSAKVQKAFEDFMKLYEESPDKTMARIMHDTKANTVSEGIGYGMMILVYMDNATNNTQTKFDKLWKYYNNFLDPKGLMNWKIVGFTGPPSGFDGKNSATDADLDVAFGLMEAYKQWGDEKYLTDAKAIIDKISKYDVTSDGYLNPGDSWGVDPTSFNPSYFSTGALQLFKQASDFNWDTVIANSYKLINKAQNATTGLMHDWCTKEGTIDAIHKTDQYSYDAARTPWRLAWAYCWYGHEDAKGICSEIATWISTSTGNDPSKVINGYNRDGTPLSADAKYNNATFVGPFACAGMVDTKHQTWVDTSYSRLTVLTDTYYYQIALKILTMLLLSGNMPDLWTTTSIAPAAGRTGNIENHSALSFKSSSNLEVAFSTKSSGNVNITICTVSGKAVSTLANGSYSAGSHRIAVTSSLTGGMYIVRMRTEGGELTERVVVTR